MPATSRFEEKKDITHGSRMMNYAPLNHFKPIKDEYDCLLERIDECLRVSEHNRPKRIGAQKSQRSKYGEMNEAVLG